EPEWLTFPAVENLVRFYFCDYSQAGQIFRSMGSVGHESALAFSAWSTTSSPNFLRALASSSTGVSVPAVSDFSEESPLAEEVGAGPTLFHGLILSGLSDESPLTADTVLPPPNPLRAPRLFTFSVYFSPFTTLSMKQ